MLSSDNFSDLLLPKFRKIFFQSYSEYPEEFSQIFNVKSSKKSAEYDYHVSGTGEWEEKVPGEPIAEEEIDTGYEVTYTHAAYAKMIVIERELADDEQYNVMEKLPQKLGRGGRSLVEKTAANVLNNGFTSAGYDDTYLFSNSHPTIKSSTVDNLMSASALSDSTLKDGLIHMRKNMVTEEGLKMKSKADKLIIPSDLEFTAMSILESIGQSGTANNDKNVIKNKLRIVVNDWLTSTTAWFLQDSNLHEMNFFWRVKPEFDKANQFDNIVAKFRGYLRFSCGYSDYRGMVGNAGAAP